MAIAFQNKHTEDEPILDFMSKAALRLFGQFMGQPEHLYVATYTFSQLDAERREQFLADLADRFNYCVTKE